MKRIIYILTVSYIIFLVYIRVNKKVFSIPLDVLHIHMYFSYLYILYIISALIIIILTIIYVIKLMLWLLIKTARKTYNETKKENKYIYLLHKFILWRNKFKFITQTYGAIFDLITPKYTKHLVTFARYCLTFTNKQNILFIYVL